MSLSAFTGKGRTAIQTAIAQASQSPQLAVPAAAAPSQSLFVFQTPGIPEQKVALTSTVPAATQPEEFPSLTPATVILQTGSPLPRVQRVRVRVGPIPPVLPPVASPSATSTSLSPAIQRLGFQSPATPSRKRKPDEPVAAPQRSAAVVTTEIKSPAKQQKRDEGPIVKLEPVKEEKKEKKKERKKKDATLTKRPKVRVAPSASKKNQPKEAEKAKAKHADLDTLWSPVAQRANSILQPVNPGVFDPIEQKFTLSTPGKGANAFRVSSGAQTFASLKRELEEARRETTEVFRIMHGPHQLNYDEFTVPRPVWPGDFAIKRLRGRLQAFEGIDCGYTHPLMMTNEQLAQILVPTRTVFNRVFATSQLFGSTWPESGTVATNHPKGATLKEEHKAWKFQKKDNHEYPYRRGKSVPVGNQIDYGRLWVHRHALCVNYSAQARNRSLDASALEFSGFLPIFHPNVLFITKRTWSSKYEEEEKQEQEQKEIDIKKEDLTRMDKRIAKQLKDGGASVSALQKQLTEAQSELDKDATKTKKRAKSTIEKEQERAKKLKAEIERQEKKLVDLQKVASAKGRLLKVLDPMAGAGEKETKRHRTELSGTPQLAQEFEFAFVVQMCWRQGTDENKNIGNGYFMITDPTILLRMLAIMYTDPAERLNHWLPVRELISSFIMAPTNVQGAPFWRLVNDEFNDQCIKHTGFPRHPFAYRMDWDLWRTMALIGTQPFKSRDGQLVPLLPVPLQVAHMAELMVSTFEQTGSLNLIEWQQTQVPGMDEEYVVVAPQQEEGEAPELPASGISTAAAAAAAAASAIDVSDDVPDPGEVLRMDQAEDLETKISREVEADAGFDSGSRVVKNMGQWVWDLLTTLGEPTQLDDLLGENEYNAGGFRPVFSPMFDTDPGEFVKMFKSDTGDVGQDLRANLLDDTLDWTKETLPPKSKMQVQARLLLASIWQTVRVMSDRWKLRLLGEGVAVNWDTEIKTTRDEHRVFVVGDNETSVLARTRAFFSALWNYIQSEKRDAVYDVRMEGTEMLELVVQKLGTQAAPDTPSIQNEGDFKVSENEDGHYARDRKTEIEKRMQELRDVLVEQKQQGNRTGELFSYLAETKDEGTNRGAVSAYVQGFWSLFERLWVLASVCSDRYQASDTRIDPIAEAPEFQLGLADEPLVPHQDEPLVYLHGLSYQAPLSTALRERSETDIKADDQEMQDIFGVSVERMQKLKAAVSAAFEVKDVPIFDSYTEALRVCMYAASGGGIHLPFANLKHYAGKKDIEIHEEAKTRLEQLRVEIVQVRVALVLVARIYRIFRVAEAAIFKRFPDPEAWDTKRGQLEEQLGIDLFENADPTGLDVGELDIKDIIGDDWVPSAELVQEEERKKFETRQDRDAYDANFTSVKEDEEGEALEGDAEAKRKERNGRRAKSGYRELIAERNDDSRQSQFENLFATSRTWTTLDAFLVDAGVRFGVWPEAAASAASFWTDVSRWVDTNDEFINELVFTGLSRSDVKKLTQETTGNFIQTEIFDRLKRSFRPARSGKDEKEPSPESALFLDRDSLSNRDRIGAWLRHIQFWMSVLNRRFMNLLVEVVEQVSYKSDESERLYPTSSLTVILRSALRLQWETMLTQGRVAEIGAYWNRGRFDSYYRQIWGYIPQADNEADDKRLAEEEEEEEEELKDEVAKRVQKHRATIKAAWAGLTKEQKEEKRAKIAEEARIAAEVNPEFEEVVEQAGEEKEEEEKRLRIAEGEEEESEEEGPELPASGAGAGSGSTTKMQEG